MATINLKAFPVPEEVACPNCRKITLLQDPAGSEFYVCNSCRSFLRFITDTDALVQKQANKLKKEPVLPVGAEGVLKGHSFKVIAYLEKKEHGTNYGWREYLLYNYEKGYANLAEYDGHWNFVAGKEFYPPLEKLRDNKWTFLAYEDVEYALFNKYTAVVTALTGEFDWDPIAEKMKTSEFIAPPFIIYREQHSEVVINHYLGEYIEAAEIATAFKVDEKLFPAKKGIGANQFSKHYSRWHAVSRLTGLLIALALIIQIVNLVTRPATMVMDETFEITRDTSKTVDDFKPFATPAFNIEGRASAVEFEVRSDVDNNWLEATIVLVNEKTNETWEVTEGIEYYHGYEGGESWSEGSQSTTSLLSSIPGGRYHLNVYPASGDPLRNSVNIKVTTNITVWMNLIITCILLCIYPAYCWYRMRNFEKQRWLNSDFSPYEEED
ncbi:hypothetical protein GCM10023149_43400 [Mucilaginibacter gynuensis]|uniref:DUF4178 domain-containing protein n=1 Tax=Mucilaginibacter gynuensis TaxID=1302236 RepID=A0ABP8H7R4_9SPHI